MVIPLLRNFNPDYVIISAGFDSQSDPYGGTKLTTIGYSYMTKCLMKECKKIIVVLEGGFDLESLKEGIDCVSRCLLNDEKFPFKTLDTQLSLHELKINASPTLEAEEIVEELVSLLKPYWKCFQ